MSGETQNHAVCHSYARSNRRILEITTDDISIKATTTEKLGFIGREEGIMAQAVVLLRKVGLITFAPMSIPVKIINQSVYPLPAYATPDAAGMDLKANIPDTDQSSANGKTIDTYRYFYRTATGV